MRRRTKRKRMTAILSIGMLLVGFVAGQVAAALGYSITGVLSSKEEIETLADAISETAGEEATGDVQEAGTQEQEESASDTEEESFAEEEQEDVQTQETGAQEDALQESELIDAADMDYTSHVQETDSETITHEAVTEVSGDVTVVDVTTIENVTEATLPEGYASTLYGKTGEAQFQVVIFGDSQFANYVDEDGMAYMLSQKLHANVYNLAIGGKTASVDPEEEGNADINSWEETCGVSMVKAVCGLADPESVFDGWDYQLNVFNSCDFDKTDLFVIEFGVNDYLFEREMSSNVNLYTYFSLYGALDQMVTDLRVCYPDAQVIVVTPTYAQFWEGGTGAFLGDSNIVSNFYGTLYNYAQTVTHVYNGHTATTVINAYENADINMYTASDDLLDGIHLSALGRTKYVNLLSTTALSVLGYEVETGYDVDLDTIDWISQKIQSEQEEAESETTTSETTDGSESNSEEG